jgi:hypothetical protein
MSGRRSLTAVIFPAASGLVPALAFGVWTAISLRPRDTFQQRSVGRGPDLFAGSDVTGRAQPILHGRYGRVGGSPRLRKRLAPRTKAHRQIGQERVRSGCGEAPIDVSQL